MKYYVSKYYVSNNDIVYRVNGDKIYIYNFAQKKFVPSGMAFIDTEWHEISESEVDDYTI